MVAIRFFGVPSNFESYSSDNIPRNYSEFYRHPPLPSWCLLIRQSDNIVEYIYIRYDVYTVSQKSSLLGIVLELKGQYSKRVATEIIPFFDQLFEQLVDEKMLFKKQVSKITFKVKRFKKITSYLNGKIKQSLEGSASLTLTDYSLNHNQKSENQFVTKIEDKFINNKFAKYKYIDIVLEQHKDTWQNSIQKTIKTTSLVQTNKLFLQKNWRSKVSSIGVMILVLLAFFFFPVLQKRFDAPSQAEPVSEIIESPSEAPIDTSLKSPSPPTVKDTNFTTEVKPTEPSKQPQPKSKRESYYSIKNRVKKYVAQNPYSEGKNKRLEIAVKKSSSNEKRKEELINLLERHKTYRDRFDKYQTGRDVSTFNGNDYYAKLWRRSEYQKDRNLTLKQMGKFWWIVLAPDNFLKFAEQNNLQAANFDKFNELLSQYLFEKTAVRHNYASKKDLKTFVKKKNENKIPNIENQLRKTNFIKFSTEWKKTIGTNFQLTTRQKIN